MYTVEDRGIHRNNEQSSASQRIRLQYFSKGVSLSHDVVYLQKLQKRFSEELLLELLVNFTQKIHNLWTLGLAPLQNGLLTNSVSALQEESTLTNTHQVHILVLQIHPMHLDLIHILRFNPIIIVTRTERITKSHGFGWNPHRSPHRFPPGEREHDVHHGQQHHI